MTAGMQMLNGPWKVQILDIVICSQDIEYTSHEYSFGIVFIVGVVCIYKY